MAYVDNVGHVLYLFWIFSFVVTAESSKFMDGVLGGVY